MWNTKKGFNHICEKLEDTKLFEFIKTLKGVHSQEKICTTLKISRSTYYAKLNKKVSKATVRGERLTQEVFKVYEEHNKIYGAPKIHAVLNKLNFNCSLKLVQRIMKKLEIKSIIVKKYKAQNTKNRKEALAGNLLEQNFKTKRIVEKIVGDITYIYTSDYGWCYLASFLDLHTKEIIGWDFSTKMTTEIVLKALENANTKRKISGAIIHTDQGSQYTSSIYSDRVQELGGILSYSRKGNPYDNACIESFHSVLKKELIYVSKIRSYEETKESLFKYIEGWYNTKRIQRKLGFLSPLEFLQAIS